MDTLLVSREGLRILCNNRQTTGALIRRNRPLQLTLEHVESGQDLESVSTLNLWDTESGARHILGLWVNEQSRTELFDPLRKFLEDNGFEVQWRNEIFGESNWPIKR